ncbi:MAG: hypothetical protein HY512_00285 [Candidatus Aenigmarchaeota archaeon]|nr:hypothetical protein [Candidatus Aenigmarchaeota archaeon]
MGYQLEADINGDARPRVTGSVNRQITQIKRSQLQEDVYVGIAGYVRFRGRQRQEMVGQVD